MHALAMAKANVENWTYVMHNAHLIERKQLEQTVEQMVSLISPLISGMQMAVEVEAAHQTRPIRSHLGTRRPIRVNSRVLLLFGHFYG